MTQTFHNYPAGWSGAALLALRASLAAFVLIAAHDVPRLPYWILGLMVALAAVILAGCQTRAASILSTLVAMLIWSRVDNGILVLPHLLDAAALVMIGPGAFSIDARLFGRTTMHLAE